MVKTVWTCTVLCYDEKRIVECHVALGNEVQLFARENGSTFIDEDDGDEEENAEVRRDIEEFCKEIEVMVEGGEEAADGAELHCEVDDTIWIVRKTQMGLSL